MTKTTLPPSLCVLFFPCLSLSSLLLPLILASSPSTLISLCHFCRPAPLLFFFILSLLVSVSLFCLYDFLFLSLLLASSPSTSTCFYPCCRPSLRSSSLIDSPFLLIGALIFTCLVILFLLLFGFLLFFDLFFCLCLVLLVIILIRFPKSHILVSCE